MTFFIFTYSIYLREYILAFQIFSLTIFINKKALSISIKIFNERKYFYYSQNFNYPVFPFLPFFDRLFYF